MTFYQGDGRWGGLRIGHPNPDGSQALAADAACVLCALNEAANLWAGRNLNPGTLNALLQRVPGAFVDGGGHPGDELYLPTAALAVGLECDGAVTGDTRTMANAIRGALALDKGGAFLRLDVDGKPGGDHTVLAIHDLTSHIECTDSAWPRQTGVTHGYCAIEWGDLTAEVTWNKRPRLYKVVGVRPVRAARH